MKEKVGDRKLIIISMTVSGINEQQSVNSAAHLGRSLVSTIATTNVRTSLDGAGRTEASLVKRRILKEIQQGAARIRRWVYCTYFPRRCRADRSIPRGTWRPCRTTPRGWSRCRRRIQTACGTTVDRRARTTGTRGVPRTSPLNTHTHARPWSTSINFLTRLE